MKKIALFVLCVILTRGVFNAAGQDPIYTSVVRKGDRVWFKTANSKKDTLVKTRERGSYDYRTIESGSAEVFVLALASDEVLNSEELLAMYHSPSQDLPEKKFAEKERVIEKATWQSGFLFDKVLVSYTTPIIFRGNMSIYARPASEEVLHPNSLMFGLTILLLGILTHLYFRFKSKYNLREYLSDVDVLIAMFFVFGISAGFLSHLSGWWWVAPIIMFILRIVGLILQEIYPILPILVEAVLILVLIALFVKISACLYPIIVILAIGYFGRNRIKEERKYLAGIWQRLFKKGNPA